MKKKVFHSFIFIITCIIMLLVFGVSSSINGSNPHKEILDMKRDILNLEYLELFIQIEIFEKELSLADKEVNLLLAEI